MLATGGRHPARWRTLDINVARMTNGPRRPPADRSPQPGLRGARRALGVRDRRPDERRGREGRRGRPGRVGRDRPGRRGGRRPIPRRGAADLRRGGDLGAAGRARRLGMPADVQLAPGDGRRPDRRRPDRPDPGGRGGRGRPRSKGGVEIRWPRSRAEATWSSGSPRRAGRLMCSGAVEAAKAAGAFTIGLACNRPSLLGELVDLEIAPLVGPEVLAGSTRLKAGTATKLVLNTLTTGAMVLIGKTLGNRMVDLQPTNEKLRHPDPADPPRAGRDRRRRGGRPARPLLGQPQAGPGRRAGRGRAGPRPPRSSNGTAGRSARRSPAPIRGRSDR